MVHHGIWDSDVPCQAMVVDLPVNGRTVKAIAQPTKQSFLYVLNRETGEPIWPIPEVPVKVGDVPDEWYSPTQPIPTKPPAYDRQNVGDDDLVDFTPAIKARGAGNRQQLCAWRRRLRRRSVMAVYDGKWGTLDAAGRTGRHQLAGWLFTIPSHQDRLHLFQDPATARGVVKAPNTPCHVQHRQRAIVPGGAPPGGRWRPVAAAARAAAVPVVPAVEPATRALTGPIQPGNATVAGLPIVKPPYGRIAALDLKDGSMAWQVAHGETPDCDREPSAAEGAHHPRTGQPDDGHRPAGNQLRLWWSAAIPSTPPMPGASVRPAWLRL